MLRNDSWQMHFSMCWDSGDLWGNVLPNGSTFPLQPKHILVILNFKSQ